jgi:hypothetical protein
VVLLALLLGLDDELALLAGELPELAILAALPGAQRERVPRLQQRADALGKPRSTRRR